MKELRGKLFFTLFIIFTSFILTLSIITIVESYNKEYSLIKESINNAFRLDDRSRLFINQKVYTVIFDSNNDISAIMSHSLDDNNDIGGIAKEILNNNKTLSISLLSRYSYLKSDYLLIIVDNGLCRESFFKTLLVIIIMFFIFEILSIVVSYYISIYLTKPVIDAFNKQKDFIADASHELKTPLAVIMASSDALESNPSEVKYLTNIKNETERMSLLVTDLLDLSKVESIDIELIDIDLSLLVNKEVLIFEPLAFENNVILESNIVDNIKIKSNIEDIRKLIGILLDNAIKHSYKEETVIVSLNKDSSNVVLTVSNKGDTILKGDIDKIFDRFYKADKSRNRDSNHYGLGLAIAKSIVLKYDGKISVTSNNNVTIFKVIFKI